MEDGDTGKYHASSVIQDFVFSSRKKGCIGCISWQVYNKVFYLTWEKIQNFQNPELKKFKSKY